uniref:Uncharacterized protein n=1 Tax=Zosterops lateralis melanops TaxID=1220523 RepID=A0A8D2NXY0_ZOSLA
MHNFSSTRPMLLRSNFMRLVPSLSQEHKDPCMSSSFKQELCCSSALHGTGTALVESAEARKPKKKFWTLLKDWGNFSLIQLEFSNFHRPPASISGGDEQRKSSCVDMYEHKIFTFLSTIVQRTRQVTSSAVLGDGEEPEKIFS